MLRTIALLSAAAILMAQEGPWPQFRGPNGSGVGAGSGYPVEFGPGKNVAWKAPVPYGQSSPVIAAGRVYVTAGEGAKLLTISLDARTGKELWRRELPRTHQHKVYPANDPASPSPAADDTGVYVFFPDFGLAAYNADGSERWRMPLGPFKNFYGMAASPILAGETVIQVLDQQRGSFLLAVHRKSGKLKWKTERPSAAIAWATPMVYRPSAGPAQLVVLGATQLDGYYLDTGEPRWFLRQSSSGSMGTVVADGDTLLASTYNTSEPWLPAFATVIAKYDKDKNGELSESEFKDDPDLGGHFGWLDANDDRRLTAAEWNETVRLISTGDFGTIALKPGAAQGEIKAEGVAWRFKKNLPYIPAPLLYQGVLYLVKDGGIVTSLDPATGKLLKEGRSPSALGEYYASPVAADGKVYLANGEGRISVLKAGPQWEVLKVNSLEEEVHATPALSSGRLYVRTRTALYCFAAPSS
ncbi:MAG: PQQ-binding-like beta-propeller repeat protein [Bryobacteraceae bacterium]|nr:PQQ-binding-like beta-propeller repeat protein [Bryobacteraceae bacterium]